MAVTVAEQLERYAIPEPNSGCFLWIGYVNAQGYGRFRANGRPGASAHRESYRLAYGEIPAGAMVLHHCDNPPCVNPRHLFLGTHLDNMADALTKGRFASGERHAKAKLTYDDVTRIRAMVGSTREVGALYGVHHSIVSKIRTFRIWKKED